MERLYAQSASLVPVSKHSAGSVYMPTKTRYGIGEYIGRNVVSLTPDGRAELHAQKHNKDAICPARQSCMAFDPRGVPQGGANCTKAGGVCSVRKYRAEFETYRNDSLRPDTIEAIGTFATV